MTHETEVEKARRITATCIADVAARKHVLEQVRKDRTCAPEAIQDAAMAYRTAETNMNNAVQNEIAVVTKFVLERAQEAVSAGPA